MQCEEFRIKYNLKEIPCCESCHEDNNMGAGDDLWFMAEGKDWHICCRLINAYEWYRKGLDAKS